MILKSLEGDDKDICKIFYPEMFDKALGKEGLVMGLKRLYA